MINYESADELLPVDYWVSQWVRAENEACHVEGVEIISSTCRGASANVC